MTAVVKLPGVVGHVEFTLICAALALVVAPVPAARRRFERVYRLGVRKPLTAWWIRVGVGVVSAALLVVGAGPTVAAALVSVTFLVRRRRAARAVQRNAENARLLEGLETVIGELRVGAHPSAAAEVAAREITGVASAWSHPGETVARGSTARLIARANTHEAATWWRSSKTVDGTGSETARAFAVAAARSRLGGSGADALCRPDSVVAVELSRIAEAWRVAEGHGLALAELLSAARADLLGRVRFRERTRAALAGARASAAVLAGLPLLGVGLGQLMGAAPLQVLFGSSAGGILLPLGAGLTCAGLLWTDAITDRVLR